MANIEARPNDGPKEREDARGRVRVSNRRTWLAVVDGEGLGEYATKREALEAARREAARVAALPGRK